MYRIKIFVMVGGGQVLHHVLAFLKIIGPLYIGRTGVFVTLFWEFMVEKCT